MQALWWKWLFGWFWYHKSVFSSSLKQYDHLKFFGSCSWFESEMVPLEMNRRVLMWLCVYPTDEKTSEWKKLAHVALTCITIISMVTIVLASGRFLIEYLSIDLEMALYSVFQISSCGSFLYACLIVLVSRQRILFIFENLTNIYRSSKDSYSNFISSKDESIQI